MAIPTTEKNRSGPQRLKFPPWLPKLEPLPKRFFSRINHEVPICAGHLRINRMKQKNHRIYSHFCLFPFTFLLEYAFYIHFVMYYTKLNVKGRANSK